MFEQADENHKAIADYEHAIAIKPTYASAYASLAWLQATSAHEKFRDGRKAVENANKAKQLSVGKNWRVLDILAAAYAECGDFETAKTWQAKTVELAVSDKSITEKGKQGLRSRLELYEKGKPYRQEPKDTADSDRLHIL